MKKPLNIFVSLIIILIIALAAYSYIFKIYETKVESSARNLFADNNSTVIITAVPIDALGMKAPFRKVSSKFEIREGNVLVDIISEDNYSGKLILRAKNKIGKVIIYVKPELSLLPTLIEINIYPNLAFNN